MSQPRKGSGQGSETLPVGRAHDDGVAVQYRESPEQFKAKSQRGRFQETHGSYAYVTVCACGREYFRGLFGDYQVACECGNSFKVPATRKLGKSHKLQNLKLAELRRSRTQERSKS